jgi:hypothetical protein
VTYGSFVQPDRSLETVADPAASLGIGIPSGYRAMNAAQAFRGQNRIFDAILAKSIGLDLNYEDQCSAQYYFDLARTLRDFHGEFDRVVEVGVFMGGSSAVLTGCMTPFGFDLDMVDVNLAYLHFAYERVRRLYPEEAGRIRLFHGDLPAYVRTAMGEPAGGGYVIHHDGAHDFNQVVRDMASLSFIRERLCAIIAQDTHLRGAIGHMNFVDMAMYAVFGLDLNYAPIGASYGASDPRTAPNAFEGNYFMADKPEGFVLPMAMNGFVYPHPGLSIDDFLPALPVAQLVASTA